MKPVLIIYQFICNALFIRVLVHALYLFIMLYHLMNICKLKNIIILGYF